MSDHAITTAERREILSLKLRAWSGKPRVSKKSASPLSVASRSGGTSEPLPPPSSLRRRLFTKHTPQEEFEYLRVDLGARQMVVPEHLLISGGRAFRRWEGW